ncbi:ECF transporter S component [Gracilibacillus thailandensis]|uniref:Riboflavin transporter n=1 Tax=Gracilibacillus thailandensis TaxID=563735 RepID=A0A6N7QXN6_9BACI|nr:ECF transporter S component [Gracilibacillus thailandensis]MRI65651.1 ECF transporter S component [Gracilibacillus thailandensis]
MNTSSAQTSNLYRLIVISIMGTISVLLMFLNFPLPFPFIPAYLRIDVSDIPALIAGIIFSPVAGVVVVAIKNILYVLVTAISDPIGALANFFAGIFYVVPVSFMYMKYRSMKSVLIGLGIGTLLMAIGLSLLNYIFFIPAYSWFMGWEEMSESVKRSTVLVGILPFNLIKGIIVGVVFALVFTKLKNWIQKK